MNKFIAAATKRYNKEDDKNLIHPISEMDGQIITEVIEIFKKLNLIAAIDILEDYKKLSDEDIALSLLDLNTKMGSYQEQVEGGVAQLPIPPERYYKTCGRRLHLPDIFCYDAIDEEIKGEMKWGILLNPIPEKVKKDIPLYANDVLVYQTEQERDQVLEVLDEYMLKYRGRFLQ